jgi:hypothetical protein
LGSNLGEELFREAFRAILTEYGGFAAFMVLMIAYLEWSRDRLWQGRLADKDKEIDRLAKERNELQDIILRKRITSTRGGKGGA